ncbi:hypothetical protein DK842_13255 [Chromobacterium phragmitis]|uniref:hypothetical protein n=1 Tax=Chromobacterium phragmitis TaxID=2202141 RepID=UPI000DEC49CD|nr:hypothetical protein [Chromobacterium phragmitis]AXE30774.1 hypothetical protein DK842_13255 [Chromobacterium phragmitis]
MPLRFFLLPLALSTEPAAASLPSYAFALAAESDRPRLDMSQPRQPLKQDPKLQLPDFDVPPPPSWALEAKKRKRQTRLQTPQWQLAPMLAPELDPKTGKWRQQGFSSPDYQLDPFSQLR